MNNIIALRAKHKISQAQLARSIGWQPTRLAHYEHGTRRIRVINAWQVVQGLQRLGVEVSLVDVFPDPKETTQTQKTPQDV